MGASHLPEPGVQRAGDYHKEHQAQVPGHRLKLHSHFLYILPRFLSGFTEGDGYFFATCWFAVFGAGCCAGLLGA